MKKAIKRLTKNLRAKTKHSCAIIWKTSLSAWSGEQPTNQYTPPRIGLHIILGHAFALGVHQPEVVRRNGIAAAPHLGNVLKKPIGFLVIACVVCGPRILQIAVARRMHSSTRHPLF